jgi:hypothetical protein
LRLAEYKEYSFTVH